MTSDNTTSDLSPDEIGHIARTLHGHEHGAIRALAQRLGIQYDTLRKAAAGSRRLGPYHTRLLREIAIQQAQMPPVRVEATIARPPASLHPGMDRDGPCGEALDPVLGAVAVAAETAGWHPAEVAAAVLTWATHRIADGAGEEHAIAALRGAAELVRPRG